jgi:anaphase-promoting complex subunit 11
VSLFSTLKFCLYFLAVAQWSWNAGDPGDVCSICQNSYEATAPGIKYPGEDSPRKSLLGLAFGNIFCDSLVLPFLPPAALCLFLLVVFGKCKHAFHLQCVSKWLSQANAKNSCPVCRQDWEFGSNPTVGAGSSGSENVPSSDSTAARNLQEEIIEVN